jgi:chemotaxis protein CheD
VLPGFEDISAFYEAASGLWIAQVLPGEFYVTKQDEIITTVLGSCVSTCMRDARAGVAGLNHFMLPEDPSGAGGASARYGVFAKEQLVNGLLRHGARRERLEVKIFGGGRVIPGMGDVGRSNVDFIHDFLAEEHMPITVEDVGLDVARRVRFHAATGKVRVLHLPVAENRRVAEREAALATRIRSGASQGDVELF